MRKHLKTEPIMGILVIVKTFKRAVHFFYIGQEFKYKKMYKVMEWKKTQLVIYMYVLTLYITYVYYEYINK